MPSRKPNLRVVYAVPTTFVRKPRVLVDMESSFMTGTAPNEINFYGYVPKGENRYHLSKTEMMLITACVSEGLSWRRALQIAFSPNPHNLIKFSQIAASKIKSGMLYLNYLRSRGAKVSDVRNGICGMAQERVAELATTIKDYQVRVTALEEGSGTGAKRRRSGAKKPAKARHA